MTTASGSPCMSCKGSPSGGYSQFQFTLADCNLVPMSFPGGSDGKESACNVGDPSSIPGSGRSPGEGNDNPLHYSCLENFMDRGSLVGLAQEIAKSQTELSNQHFHTHPRCSFPKPLIHPKVKLLSRVWLFWTPGTVACQTSMAFCREGYWSGLPFPFLGRVPSWPRGQTRVSCTAARLFTIWATKEAPNISKVENN